MRRSVFLLPSLWEKGGSGHAGILKKGRMVVELVVGRTPPPHLSFNSTLPHCPQVHPFLEPGGGCEVCVRGKCRVGAFIETEQSGTSRIVFPPAAHPPAASLPVSLLLSPWTKNALNAWRLLQCQITKG